MRFHKTSLFVAGFVLSALAIADAPREMIEGRSVSIVAAGHWLCC